MESLSGSVAIVTGGSRGIGRAIVKALCKKGAKCIFTYISSEAQARELSVEIEAEGGEALPVRADVRDFEQVKTLVEKAKELGRYDILVNNAGITRDRAFMFMSPEEWREVIDTNLTGVFNTTRASIISFLKQQSGNIINISSLSGIHPMPGQVNYASSKAGIIGFTKALAREVAPYNIRVNAVAPGFIHTDMTEKIPARLREKLMETIPFKRFGTPEEVARIVLYLVSDASSYITGQTIEIDGGLGLLG
ncbi:MAG: 3-oxoacyl-[acyl-carrier-protein] reductase [Thermodesulfovibrionales bacterium]|nr:3-oxoacyl-[acyl-carrier-protein] reductase [Thermodesulfovibrionales bacterium]